MDIFQHRYYRLNKIFLATIGLWPYQSTRVRCGLLGVILIIPAGHVMAQTMATVKYYDDKGIFLECVSQLVLIIACLTKIMSSTWNSTKILQLLNRIRIDWQVWARDREANILHRYAEKGRNITIAYTVAMYLCSFLFLVRPVIPKIIDVLWKNGSKPGEFPTPLDYYHLDMQKYYFCIITYCCVCAFLSTLCFVACDTMFMVCVQHGSAIFAALGHKLERIGKDKRTAGSGKNAYVLIGRDMNFEDLVSCINKHNDAIGYAQMIEAAYSWSLFFIMGLNVILMSLIAIQIIENANDLYEIINLITWAVVVMMHFYIESHMAQILMDHSISIRYYIHNSQWFSLSLKAQKLLPVMVLRCNTPCKITAGLITTMSMETFTVFLKTTMSYFTLLRSSM